MTDKQQTTDQAERAIGDMIDLIALNNHLIRLQDQVIIIGDNLLKLQKRVQELEYAKQPF
jgi:hypothetical protein